MQVIKRGGKVYQEFDKTRIETAIISAFESCNIELSPEKLELIMSNILMEIEKFNIISVEHIQDIVERNISLFNFEVAKKFIIYRYEHKEDRILRDRIDYMSTYINSDNNAATSSEEDSNSNVTVKNVANLNGETFKNLNRRLQRLWIKDKLNELFPEVSKQYAKDLEHHIIYAHDEASFPVPTNYCEAVSLYPLIMNGTSTMDGLKTKPPTNLNSFCGQLINLTFLLAAQCKGAVAYGEFFNFFDYFCVKEWGPEWDKHIKDVVTSNVCNKEKTIEHCIKQAFQNIVYSWNQPAGNRSYQSPFINISYYDSNYWKSLFEDFSFPDGSKPEWRRIDILQKMFMQWFNEERQKTLLTFPVETMALLTDGNDVIDKDYKNFTAEMWSKGHSFFLYISDNPDGLSSCCRLRNSIDSNVFSFTNGLSGVKTGSCNVITLNLNRIIQDWCKSIGGVPTIGNQHDSLKFYLINILERVYKYHIAYKTLLYEEEKRGMLTASNAGYISMKDLFSTIGLNGLNEAAEFLGIKCNYNSEYKDFCNLILGTISEQNKLHSTKEFKFNTEIVPAEQLGSRNYNWDKADGYKVPENRVLYNSYFYLPEDNTISILDKFKLHGREFTSNCDGGMGLHCNLDSHLSKNQYLKLIDYAIKCGTFYFTFNIPNTQCDDCGHIEKIPIKECPICHSKNVTHWTRPVGYLRPTKCFDEYRYKESLMRFYANGKFEIEDD